MKKIHICVVFSLACCLLAAGCLGRPEYRQEENGARAPLGTLRPGDSVTVVFSGVSTPPNPIDQRIKEDGTITLPLIGAVEAGGKKRGELEEAIKRRYVDGNYYGAHLSVTVRTENRVFYVRGQVNQQGRLPYLGEMTVTKAIAAAGGFTDFAKKDAVELIRASGEPPIVVDVPRAEDNPEFDPPVYPDDLIIVPRRFI